MPEGGEHPEVEVTRAVATPGLTLRPGANDPKQIGPFRILGVLGEGGMGRVYEAEQDQPRRIVALKVIRPGIASAQGLARFERESQVLGRLQHPGIAAIYQAGTADTGDGTQPWYAMELVRGRTLLDYAQEHALSARDRASLMARVCDAVQHAHQKGVIHRDLKPGNILVDETGQPKVLDFGVARVTDGDLQATLRTDVGQLVGTLPYMSPEQVQAEPSEIDTRSDVYALGVVLYQLLTGRLPHAIDRRSIPEGVRAIVEDDPTPMSSIDRTLRGDLETIAGRALEKERDRRYASAAELAADLRRFVADEPILAHAPSTLYQLRKFARRNRVLVGGVVAVIVVLAAGLVASLTQAYRATRAERQAKAVNGFLKDMLAAANPQGATATDSLRGRNVTVVEVLDEASKRLERGELSGQPALEAEARRTLGATYQELGEFRKAGVHLERSLALRPPGSDPLERAASLEDLGWLRQAEGHPDVGEPLFRESLALRSRVLAPDDTLVVRAMINLASALQDQSRTAPAESLYRKVLATPSRTPSARRNRADALHSLGALLVADGRPAEAEPVLREALAIKRAQLGPGHAKTAQTLESLAQARLAEGDRVEGEKLLRETVDAWSRSLGTQHPYYATALSNLGGLLRDEGRLAEAEPLLKQALDVGRAAWGEDDAQVAAMRYNYARLLQSESKLAQAEPEFARAVASMEKSLPADHPSLATARSGLGSVRTDLGRPTEGEPLLRQALATYEDILPAGSWQIGQVKSVLGANLAAQRRYAEAESLLVGGYEMLKASPAAPPDRKKAALERLVHLYDAWAKASPDASRRAAAAKWKAELMATDSAN